MPRPYSIKHELVMPCPYNLMLMLHSMPRSASFRFYRGGVETCPYDY